MALTPKYNLALHLTPSEYEPVAALAVKNQRSVVAEIREAIKAHIARTEGRDTK